MSGTVPIWLANSSSRQMAQPAHTDQKTTWNSQPVIAGVSKCVDDFFVGSEITAGCAHNCSNDEKPSTAVWPSQKKRDPMDKCFNEANCQAKIASNEWMPMNQPRKPMLKSCEVEIHRRTRQLLYFDSFKHTYNRPTHSTDQRAANRDQSTIWPSQSRRQWSTQSKIDLAALYTIPFLSL